MNFKRDLENISNRKNVTLAWCSPRASGEHESRSAWKEIDYKEIPQDYKGRIALIKFLAEIEGSKVWIRPATEGGHIRIWVSK